MKILTSLLIILCCCSMNAYATDYKFVAEDNKRTTKICLAAVTDNTEVMKVNLRMLQRGSGSVLSFRTLINAIQCNNQYIGNFAKTYNALNTFAYLDQFTNKSNKRRQTSITIEKMSNQQEINKTKTIVVLVGSN